MRSTSPALLNGTGLRTSGSSLARRLGMRRRNLCAVIQRPYIAMRLRATFSRRSRTRVATRNADKPAQRLRKFALGDELFL